MTVAILTRMYNSAPRVKVAVEQMRRVEDEVTWRVLYSQGTDDTVRVLFDELERNPLPSNVQFRIVAVPEISAQEAICQLFEWATEDELFIFDDDNWFLPNRVLHQQKLCAEPKGICAVRTISWLNGEIFCLNPTSPRANDKNGPLEWVAADMIIDAGAMRIKREYAQERLVPLTRTALREGAGPQLFEDRFWAAVAATDGELCYHSYPLHLYRLGRPDSQMVRMGKTAQNELFDWTTQKILEAVGPKLGVRELESVTGARLLLE